MNAPLKICDAQVEDPAAGAAPSAWRRLGGRAARGTDWLLRLLDVAVLLPVFAGIYYLSYWLRFEGQLGRDALEGFRATVALVVAVKVAWFVGLGACRTRNRPATFYELIVLTRAATAGLFTLLLVSRHWLSGLLVPRSICLLDWGTTIVVVGGARAVLRRVQETGVLGLRSSQEQVRAVIVGVNDAGEMILRALRAMRRPAYRVIGFLDDDPRHYGTLVDGVPVLGGLEEVAPLAARHKVQQVLVVQGELSGAQLRALMDDARQRDFTVRVLPSYKQLIDGTLTAQPRPVSIEDLLQRKPVLLNMGKIREWIDDRVIMVTGSAGSIGSEISRQLLQFSPRRLVLVDQNETGQFFLDRQLRAISPDVEICVCLADILNEHRVRALLRQHRPQVIFHAAAYKHVPMLEAHPEEAVQNIVAATRRLADLAMEYRAGSFVMISTDKAVNPTSVMGTCKRVAELYVQSLTGRSMCRFVTVRFGNVLDSAGSVVQIFRQQIATGGPVTVTDPQMRRYFMTIPEAARLVIQAGAIGEGGQILLLDMGDPVRIADMAVDMIRLSGLRPGGDIAIEFTGLRPGEKLFEELCLPGERRVATSHPKIIVAEHKKTDRERVVKAIDQLELLAREAPEKIPAQLQGIVQEYHRGEQPELHEKRAA
jgi:FlaA1/EpsC-like NDP-sugar epimerase